MAEIYFPFSIRRPSKDVPVAKASTIDVDRQIGDIDATDLQTVLEKLSAGKLTVDKDLDSDSENPVQNKVLANILIFS